MFLKKNDNRFFKHLNQIQKRGFSDSETWALDYTIAAFILPRLKRFRQITNGHPGHLTMEGWYNILMKIEYSFSMLTDDYALDKDDPEFKEGMKLFANYITHFWW